MSISNAGDTHIVSATGWTAWGNQRGGNKLEIRDNLVRALHHDHMPAWGNAVLVCTAKNPTAAEHIRKMCGLPLPTQGCPTRREAVRIECMLQIAAKTRACNATLPLAVALGIFLFACACPVAAWAVLSMMGVATSHSWTREHLAELCKEMPPWWSRLEHHGTIRRTGLDNNQFRAVIGVERADRSKRKDRSKGFHALSRIEICVTKDAVPAYLGAGAYSHAPSCLEITNCFANALSAIGEAWRWAWTIKLEGTEAHALVRPRDKRARMPWVARQSMVGRKTNNEKDIAAHLRRAASENEETRALLDEGDQVLDPTVIDHHVISIVALRSSCA